MIYDPYGTPLRNRMGFLRGYQKAAEERMEVSLLGTQHTQPEEPENLESSDTPPKSPDEVILGSELREHEQFVQEMAKRIHAATREIELELFLGTPTGDRGGRLKP